MAIRDQDHGGIAMAMPIALGCFDQALDFTLGEIIRAATVNFARSNAPEMANASVHTPPLGCRERGWRQKSLRVLNMGPLSEDSLVQAPPSPRPGSGADGSRSLCATV